MNFDNLKRSKKSIPLQDIQSNSFDTRYQSIDPEHVKSILSLLKLSEKLETLPIVSEDGYVLRSRHGVQAWRAYVVEKGIPAYIEVEILPIRLTDLTKRDAALLRAWSAGFDLDPNTTARKLLDYRDQYELVKSMLRDDVSKSDIRKSLPDIPAFVMDELLRRAPSAVLQDRAAQAAALVRDAKMTMKEAFKIVGLDATDAKHVSKFQGHYDQMTKGWNLGKKSSFMDDSHVIGYYARAGERFLSSVSKSAKFWHNSYFGETGTPDNIPGTIIMHGKVAPFSSATWKKLLDMQQSKINAAQGVLNDARTKMESSVGVLSAGETVTCTFTNTQRGTIIVKKAAVGKS